LTIVYREAACQVICQNADGFLATPPSQGRAPPQIESFRLLLAERCLRRACFGAIQEQCLAQGGSSSKPCGTLPLRPRSFEAAAASRESSRDLFSWTVICRSGRLVVQQCDRAGRRGPHFTCSAMPRHQFGRNPIDTERHRMTGESNFLEAASAAGGRDL